MRLRQEHGTTLIENMIAVAIIMIVATGVLGLGMHGVAQVGSATHITYGTTIAQDLLNQIALWDYGDLRLANAKPANDADLGDSVGDYESMAAPPADHGEADLTLGGANWTGIPAVAPYQRFWNVASAGDSNGNGTPDGLFISVIVRWPEKGGWRRVVLFGVKSNPADQML